MTDRSRPMPRLRLALIALGLVLAAPAGAQTITNNSFGGFSKSSSDPIDIESDVLVVHDSKKYATFKGNVKAVQGSTTLKANELDVHYVGGGGDAVTGGASQDPAKPQDAANPQAAATKPDAAKSGDAPQAAANSQDAAKPQTAAAKPDAAKTGGAAGLGGAGAQISQIEARGNVSITSDKDQTTTSDWAIYDVPTQIVTVGGNVVLTQGKNVLKGDQLVIDLKTGESRFENKGDTVTGGRIRALFMPKDAKPGDDKSEEGKSADAASGGDKPDKEKGKDKAAKKAAKQDAAPAQPGPAATIPDPLDSGQ